MKNIILGMLSLVMVIGFTGHVNAQAPAKQECDSIFTMKAFSMDSVEYLYRCEMTQGAEYIFKYSDDQVSPGELLTAIIPNVNGLKGDPERVVNTTEFDFKHTAGMTGTYIVALYKKKGGKDAKRLEAFVSDMPSTSASAVDDASNATKAQAGSVKDAAKDVASDTKEAAAGEMTKAEKKAAKAAAKAEKKAQKEKEKAEKKAAKAAAKAEKAKGK